MTSFWAVACGLVVVAAAEAGGRGQSGSHGGHYRGSSYHSSSRYYSHNTRSYDYHNGNSRHGYNDYHLTYGTKFSHGYYYTGRYHSHWSYRYWCGRYNCWYYYDPCCHCSYYWYAPSNCWYPEGYASVCEPTSSEGVTEVNQQVPEVAAPATDSGPVITSGPTQSIAVAPANSGDSDGK
jgi:hypothetical protein